MFRKKTAPFKQILQDIKENPNPESLWQQVTHIGKFTWEEFENESMGLLAAGFGSTSISLCWVLHSLTKYPSVKSKVKQEIDSVLGGRSPTTKDLDNLPYLEKFILETFRFHPIIRMNSRNAIEQDSIGEYQIPKGTVMYECPNYTIRTAVDNPDIFDPDRFNQENMKELSKIAMSTFSMGYHVCVGKNLALLELKLITVFLMQQNTEIDVDITKDYFNPCLPTKTPNLLTATRRIAYKRRARKVRKMDKLIK